MTLSRGSRWPADNQTITSRGHSHWSVGHSHWSVDLGSAASVSHWSVGHGSAASVSHWSVGHTQWSVGHGSAASVSSELTELRLFLALQFH